MNSAPVTVRAPASAASRTPAGLPSSGCGTGGGFAGFTARSESSQRWSVFTAVRAAVARPFEVPLTCSSTASSRIRSPVSSIAAFRTTRVVRWTGCGLFLTASNSVASCCFAAPATFAATDWSNAAGFAES
ncbi:hypothetical protein ACGFMK_03975 [Amycolatopsis sp. NPDC049252]|uniref:hypothetical protein n=1 Tax=Amycolatopsis sp. NPDC049252 TaxID=3363933 RepID=UPI003715F8CA